MMLLTRGNNPIPCGRRHRATCKEGNGEYTHVRVKEEVPVSKERVEQFKDPHQLCWTELYPTAQLKLKNKNVIRCTCTRHTHCL